MANSFTGAKYQFFLILSLNSSTSLTLGLIRPAGETKNNKNSFCTIFSSIYLLQSYLQNSQLYWVKVQISPRPSLPSWPNQSFCGLYTPVWKNACKVLLFDTPFQLHPGHSSYKLVISIKTCCQYYKLVANIIHRSTWIQVWVHIQPHRGQLPLWLPGGHTRMLRSPPWKVSCVHIVHCDVQEAGQAVPRYAVIVERQKRSQNEKELKGDPSWDEGWPPNCGWSGP